MSLGVLNNLSAIYAENNLNNTNNSLRTRAAAVVFRIEDQLRRRRRCRPFSGRRPSGQPPGPDAVANQRTGRRRPAASRRWRTLASDQPAQPGRDAGYRSLERHPQRIAGYGRQPGIPVDPLGNQQHRHHHHLQPGAGLQLQHQHLHRRLFQCWRFDRRSEYSLAVFRRMWATRAAPWPTAAAQPKATCSSIFPTRGESAARG